MSEHNNAVVIVGYARTPMGNFRGELRPLTAPELGAVAIKAALTRSGVDAHSVDEILMGCVLTACIGQAPARQAALAAGLPLSVGCTTVNKMCGSGMKTIMLGADLIKAGSAEIIVAGGMESMSNAPYLLPKVRDGLRIGHARVLDHLFLDGLEDPEEKRLMGCFAEDCVEKYSLSRDQQDDFAKQSLIRAQTAMKEGWFKREIAPVSYTSGGQEITVSQDEQPRVADVNKISRLKPVFKRNGTVTAANSSGISDGAAAVVLMVESEAQRCEITPLARLVDHQTHAQEPAWFTTAPVYAIEKLLDKLQLQISDIDLFEINEAFAAVPLAVMKDLDLPLDKINVHGGACALGHPIGVSGARIIVTLLSALEKYDLNRGMASLCIAGGEATAMVIER
jgi:acetyl-CoA C-acetyltransferase